MRMRKIYFGVLLALLFAFLMTVPVFAAEAGVPEKTGFYEEDSGVYYYTEGEKAAEAGVEKDTAGVVDATKSWWYFGADGRVDTTYNGFAKNSNGWWYIENGKVTFLKNSVIQDKTGALGTKGTWYYVTGSKVRTDFTGLADYSNANGWWYIRNGKVDFSVNTVAKNKNGWYYVSGGKVNFSYNGFAKNSNGWWYIEKGKVTFQKNSVIQDKTGALGTKGTWYYVTGSKVQTGFTGLADYSNANGWWYIRNGKVDFSVNTVAQNKNGWWYVTGGKVQFGFTGLANYANANGWWYIKNGKVDFTANTVAKNKNGWWYVSGGKVIFSYNGFAKNSNGWWYIEKGKVTFQKNGTVYGTVEGITGNWTVSGSKVKMPTTDVTTLLKNAMKPVGSTLYVWGGGWNAADTGAGETALYKGVYPQWATYFNQNANGYSYLPGKTSWQNGNRQSRFYGLDCSGYIGWTLYNSILSNGKSGGYVTTSTKMASTLASYGYGTAQKCTASSTFKAGDIISISGHVYLCLGQCSDGSVLLVHSTPNGGVQVSGTVKSGASSSQASKLATEYMKTNYPTWWKYFGSEGKQAVNASSYLTGTKFTWKSDSTVMDSAGLRNKTADQVLAYLE
ncbi:MAG: hypothetical protein LIO96_07525 [Lachnospiraceae bacterium]|nr:hypothetical protein [Lachnospiraceae bacterium]